MIRMTVLYEQPTDVEAFDAHYLGTHVPLAQALPEVERVEVVRFSPGPDGNPPQFHLMTGLYFADADAMGRALGSEAGKALAADVANLGGTPASRFLGTVE